MTRMRNSERFWRNTRTATQAAETDPETGRWFRAKRAALDVDTDQRTRVRRWKPRSRKPRRPHRGGAITVDPSLSRDIGRLMGDIAPRLQKAFDDHLAPLAGATWAFWPVESRLSKSAVALEYGIEGGGRRFRGSIYLRAPYSLLIKGSPARKHLISQERLVVTQIAEDALDDLARRG